METFWHHSDRPQGFRLQVCYNIEPWGFYKSLHAWIVGKSLFPWIRIERCNIQKQDMEPTN
jgi:hypothetical protein